MHKSRWLGVIVVALIAPSALADDVPPPPPDCPSGAAGATGHNGEWCRPTTCDTDDECGASYYDKRPRVCRTQALCVAEVTETSHGRDPRQSITRSFAYAICKAGDSCVTGTCVEAKRCVLASEQLPELDPKPDPKAEPDPKPEPQPASAPATTPASGKSGCAGGGAAGLLGLVVLALRRARR